MQRLFCRGVYLNPPLESTNANEINRDKHLAYTLF